MTPLESIRIVARHFNGLGIPDTFLGASVLPLLVDHPELLEIRFAGSKRNFVRLAFRTTPRQVLQSAGGLPTG